MRNRNTKRLLGNVCIENEMIRFASKDIQCGVRLRQEAASDLKLVRLKEPGVFVWQQREKST